MKAGSCHTEEAKEKISLSRTGAKNPRWKGGRAVDSSGYFLVLEPGHPHADYNGYVLEHRLVVEKDMKRFLMPDEHVHHWNGIRDDNRPENLAVMDPEAHIVLHNDERRNASHRV